MCTFCTGKISTFRRIWNPDTAAASDSSIDSSADSSDSATPGTDWAAGDAPFAELLYSTYSAKYFEEWNARYAPMGADGFKYQEWIRYDYGKPGSPSLDRQTAPTLVDAWAYDSKYDGNTVCTLCLQNIAGSAGSVDRVYVFLSWGAPNCLQL